MHLLKPRITGFIAASGGSLVRLEEETRSLADSLKPVWTVWRSDRRAHGHAGQ